MARKRRSLERILANPKGVRFSEMVVVIEAFGFHLSRVKGSHHIFAHPGIVELVNLQDVNGEAKPYQIRQFLQLVERYDLEMEERS